MLRQRTASLPCAFLPCCDDHGVPQPAPARPEAESRAHQRAFSAALAPAPSCLLSMRRLAAARLYEADVSAPLWLCLPQACAPHVQLSSRPGLPDCRTQQPVIAHSASLSQLSSTVKLPYTSVHHLRLLRVQHNRGPTSADLWRRQAAASGAPHAAEQPPQPALLTWPDHLIMPPFCRQQQVAFLTQLSSQTKKLMRKHKLEAAVSHFREVAGGVDWDVARQICQACGCNLERAVQAFFSGETPCSRCCSCKACPDVVPFTR